MTEISSIDPTRAALIVLDMHVGVAGPGSDAGEHAEAQNTVANIAGLLEVARANEVLVIHAHHRSATGVRPGGLLPPLFRELADDPDMQDSAADMAIIAGLEPRDGEIVVHKERFGAFAGTGLDMILRAAAVDTIILTGTYTNLSVESTARYGADIGYRCVLAADALCSISAEWHDGALEHGLSVICEIGSSAEVESALGVAGR
ncbi:isochorismatase family cysteine hydrolase [Mycobacterium sp. AT1]|uniref:isochorismatase family cysteine hydrolase n=1 Tax=Mycobacterium sp. AT1 TaxID=1961706 RepID=UPI001153539E|nr:isochorismatase family cysteine hydrolase [Mycobacterium sp. AT1]